MRARGLVKFPAAFRGKHERRMLLLPFRPPFSAAARAALYSANQMTVSAGRDLQSARALARRDYKSARVRRRSSSAPLFYTDRFRRDFSILENDNVILLVPKHNRHGEGILMEKQWNSWQTRSSAARGTRRSCVLHSFFHSSLTGAALQQTSLSSIESVLDIRTEACDKRRALASFGRSR